MNEKNLLVSIWKSRRLIAIWTRYNIEANYLEKKLGLVWLVLQPLFMTAIYSLVFSWVLDNKPRGGVPFVNFFLAGMIVWLSFNGVIMRSTTIVSQKISLIGQIQFPRAVLIFTLFAEEMVDFFISLIILMIISLAAGYYPTVTYLYIPIIFLVLFFIELGGMFLLSTLGLFLRDIPQIVSIFLRLLFYFSAVIFPADILPENVARMLAFNPIFFLVESFRNALFYAEAPNFFWIITWFIFSVFFLWCSFSFFQRKAVVFSDYR